MKIFQLNNSKTLRCMFDFLTNKLLSCNLCWKM